MDKRTFINLFANEDSNVIANIYDNIVLTEKTNMTQYTSEFIPPNIWSKLIEIQNKFDVDVDTYGVFEDSERRLVCFSTYDTIKEYPLCLMKIKNKSKFKELGHRDYLGSLLSLGIKREKIGDLIIKNGMCFVAVCLDISDFIKYNLDMVSNCPCEVEVVEINDEIILSKEYEEKIYIITSERLDCVVSSICNISRKISEKLINANKVLVNYNVCTKKNILVKKDDILTIRGYGKFKVGDTVGNTARDRIKLKVLKYI